MYFQVDALLSRDTNGACVVMYHGENDVHLRDERVFIRAVSPVVNNHAS